MNARDFLRLTRVAAFAAAATVFLVSCGNRDRSVALPEPAETVPSTSTGISAHEAGPSAPGASYWRDLGTTDLESRDEYRFAGFGMSSGLATLGNHLAHCDGVMADFVDLRSGARRLRVPGRSIAVTRAVALVVAEGTLSVWSERDLESGAPGKTARSEAIVEAAAAGENFLLRAADGALSLVDAALAPSGSLERVSLKAKRIVATSAARAVVETDATFAVLKLDDAGLLFELRKSEVGQSAFALDEANCLVLSGAKGELASYSCLDGTRVWSVGLKTGEGAVAADAARAFVASGGELVALSRKDGTTVARAKTEATRDPVLAVGIGRVFLASRDGLSVRDAATLEPLAYSALRFCPIAGVVGEGRWILLGADDVARAFPGSSRNLPVAFPPDAEIRGRIAGALEKFRLPGAKDALSIRFRPYAEGARAGGAEEFAVFAFEPAVSAAFEIVASRGGSRFDGALISVFNERGEELQGNSGETPEGRLTARFEKGVMRFVAAGFLHGASGDETAGARPAFTVTIAPK